MSREAYLIALPSALRALDVSRERGKFEPRLGSLSLCEFCPDAAEEGQILTVGCKAGGQAGRLGGLSALITAVCAVVFEL